VALQFATQPQSVQPAEWTARLCAVRGFARYRSGDDPATQIPPLGLLPYRPPRARPYLYSEEEIRQLLQAAKNLPATYSLKPWTYHCLFGLLAVTGLRISEALNLQLADVDWSEGILTIQGAKFGKSRLVPLHASTRRALLAYTKRRDRFFAEAPISHFFASSRGQRLDGGDVRRTFYKLSRQIGLRTASASHGPRLHDFRHRFAVQTLLRWYRKGVDVERRLPILSTYLGHAHVTDTYWYLTSTPELRGAAGKRMEKRWGGVL
jgi:integrase